MEIPSLIRIIHVQDMDTNLNISEISFDDVLLLPNASDIPIGEERRRIDLSTRLSREITLDIPIISAPMPTVTGSALAVVLGKKGGIGFIHPFQDNELVINEVRKVKEEGIKVGAGVCRFNSQSVDHVGALLDAGADIISLEHLSGHTKEVISFVKTLKQIYPTIQISSPVVVTAGAVHDLAEAGIDSIRVGIGGGSHCTTRLQTGVGRPQLSALAECSKAAQPYNIPVISDTGIRYPGDIAKALVFGAETVMIGGIFAGCSEASGKTIYKSGKPYKYTYGICTNKATRKKEVQIRPSFIQMLMSKLEGTYPEATTGQDDFEEGVSGLVPVKGDAGAEIDELTNGLRRSLWYTGAHTIAQLRERTKIVRISTNTQQESGPRI